MDMRRLPTYAFGLLFFLASWTAAATTSSWPDPARSIQTLVPSQAGSGVGNTIARVITEALSEELGNRIVLQNFSSSTSFSGMLTNLESNTDGYTLLFATVETLIIEPGLHRTPAFQPLESFVPIGLVAEIPHIIVVNNNLPAQSVGELTDHIGKYPGMVHFGSSGNGSALHLAGEAYMSATGTNMVHVPYSAAEPATNNLVSGDIQVMFPVLSGVLNYIRTDRLRALAVMSSARSPALPEVATLAEVGYPNVLATKWYALLAPRGTPREIIDRYNDALNSVLSSETLQERLLEAGATPLGGSPEHLARFLAQETARWERVIGEAHLQPR